MKYLFKKIDHVIREINHARIDATRALILKFTKFIFDGSSCFSKSVQDDDAILVMRLDGKIGDSITATGFIKSLKLSCPTSKLVVLTSPSSAVIYQNLPFIDQVIVLKKGFFSSLKCFFKLRQTSWKFIINTSHVLTPRVVFLASCLQAYKKTTFLNENFKLFNIHVKYDILRDHVTYRYANTLTQLGFDLHELDYQFILDSKQLDLAQIEIKKLRKKYSKIIILNSFAGARLRNFNQQTTLGIVQELVKDSQSLIISIGNYNDLPIAEKWITHFNHPQWICFAGHTDFCFNAALISCADLVITPDTAIVHIASALKKKLVCVYREDGKAVTEEKNSLIWAPFQTEAAVKSAVIYAPQSLETPDDINTVRVDDVIKAVLKML